MTPGATKSAPPPPVDGMRGAWRSRGATAVRHCADGRRMGGVDDRDAHTRMMDALIAQWRADGVWPPKGPVNDEQRPPLPEGEGRALGLTSKDRPLITVDDGTDKTVRVSPPALRWGSDEEA